MSLEIYKAPDHTACPDINIYDKGLKNINSLFDANLFLNFNLKRKTLHLGTQ